MSADSFNPLTEEEVKAGRELCARCGFTLYNHIGNTGVTYPCWEPSGRYSHNKHVNQSVFWSGASLRAVRGEE